MFRHVSVFLIGLLTSAHVFAGLATTPVAEGFDRPVWVGVPTGVQDKLWVIEQAGIVWIVDSKTGKRGKEPFLNIQKVVSRRGGEEGLLGLAFSPDFEKSGRYYVNYTDHHKQTRIARFISTDRRTTDIGTEEILMEYPSEFPNHNGGWIGFGPDGYLYIANGDGGSGNDPNNRGQALDSLLGKILRIDVSGEKGYQSPKDNPFIARKGALPEIWAYGVRNPWRCSFDSETGDFWMGDVGQNHFEEINFVAKGKGAGKNYGWRLREGDKETPANGVGGPLEKSTEPVYVYNHGNGSDQGLSVTGGYVYRGPIKELQGRYVFADYQNPRIWSFKLVDGKTSDFKDHTKDLQPKKGRINLIASFGEANDGNLWIVDHTGSIHKIIEN